MLVGWPYFHLKTDQIFLPKAGPKLCSFFILDQMTINAAVTDTVFSPQRYSVRIVIGAKPDSNWRGIRKIEVFLDGFENFHFEVVWALKYWPFENDRGMAGIPFKDAVIFYFDIIGFSNNFIKLVEILQDVLLKLIWGLDFFGLELWVICGLLGFELGIVIDWRAFGLGRLFAKLFSRLLF